ncbi:MAG: hypothetical protein DRJ42_25885 [Deltaproteobacteria bacterium]|nr:MAG: hypothetical protein DRJ42_25885 [Deltaproteobacteria bacterium]
MGSTMRRLVVATLLTMLALSGCAQVAESCDERAPALGDEGKADGPAGVDVLAMLAPGEGREATVTGARDQLGYVLYAEAGTEVKLEVTHRGSSRGFDSYLQLRGPRRADDGDYPEVLATDDDAGYGQLSRLTATVPEAGFYLAQVSVDEEARAAFTEARFRLLLTCEGSRCDADGPIAPMGDDVHWVRNAAEYRALSIQAYRTATAQIEAMHAAGELPPSWTVTFDADETLISNAQHERERQELGLGYSARAWSVWVNRREATAIPGAAAFTARIHELGGHVAVVTNRKAADCDATLDNLRTVGIAPDGILCRVGTSNKTTRWQMVEDGRAGDIPPTTLVMWVGDNIHDFQAMGQEVRHEDESALEAFGSRFIIIPNPMYGSWARNERL